MQAVILAAGKSTRTYPLTLTKPKPLLKIANKTLLEHNLDNLQNVVKEVIIVVGYKKEMIKYFLKNKYKYLKFKFVEQKEQNGTGHALSLVEKFIKDKFIFMFGDDIYHKNDVQKIIKNKYSILTAKVKNPKLFGVIIQNNDILINIIEKPQLFVSDKISCGMMVLDKKIFNFLKNVKISKRGEYELTDALRKLAIKEDIHCVESEMWLPIGYPWDLLKADKILRKNKNFIGENSKIEGKVENCSIGKNTIINGKVKNSMVMDESIIDIGSVVEDSIIGENVYFSGKAKSGKNVKSLVKKKNILVEKLGTIISDNVRAENVDIKPGCKIWPHKNIKGKIKNDIL